MKKNFLTSMIGVDPLRPDDDDIESNAESDVIDTDLVLPDESPFEGGYTHMTPSFDEAEMLRAYESPGKGDEYAAESPQEAYEAMQYQAPLSEDEKQILNETPFLDHLSWVDDPDHDELLYKRQKEGNKAMDENLEDEMYGDLLEGDDMLVYGSEEPGVTAQGTEKAGRASDVGWGIPGFIKKAVHGVEHAAGKVANVAERGLAAPFSLAAKVFNPGRDKQKAALLRATNAKLINGHAAWLMTQDVKSGRPKQSKVAYLNASKTWAKTQLQRGGLPTSYTSGEVATTILGADVMGSWWNPFSWFQSRTNYVLQNAQGQMISMNQAQWDAYQGTLAAQSTQPPGTPPDASSVDPATGLPLDPTTGQPIDPSTGQPMDPATAAQYAAQQQQGAPPDPSQYAAPPDPSQYAAPPAYDPSQYAAPAYDPTQDPSSPYYIDPSQSSGEDMSNEGLDSLLYGENEDALMYGEGEDALMFGESDTDYDQDWDWKDSYSGADYDFVVGGDGGRSISSEGYKKLCLKKAQTRTGNEVPAAKDVHAAHKHLARKLKEKKIKVRPPEGTTSGAWLYKLNPLYWMASTNTKEFIDTEKAADDAAEASQKHLRKEQGELEAGRSAMSHLQAAQSAQTQAQAADQELAALQATVTSGKVDSMGATSITLIGAATKQGRADAQKTAAAAGGLAAKLEAGQKLTPEEIGKLRSCLKMCGSLKKLHDQLHAQMPPGSVAPTASTTTTEAPVTSSGYHDYTPGFKSNFLGKDISKREHAALVATKAKKMGGEKAIHAAMASVNKSLASHGVTVEGEPVHEILGEDEEATAERLKKKGAEVAEAMAKIAARKKAAADDA